MPEKKLLLIGLDCAEPDLVFDRFADDLPVLSRLRKKSTWGRLRSCDPPITIPAWTVMFSGRNPGQLGLYGFRMRRDYSYDRLSLTSSRDVDVPRIWDVLSAGGKKCIVAGVPQTYPPSPLNGEMISGLLTPSADSMFTYPESLRDEVLSHAPEYRFDVSGFRNAAKDLLIREINDMTDSRFSLILHFMETREWDCLILVEIGLDRMQHSFWGYAHADSPYYETGGKYSDTLFDYYRRLDSHIGGLIELMDKNTHILVVSDHGAQTLHGSFCINEWLIQKNWLVLKQYPEALQELSPAQVDWTRTRAWAEGGYYARINLNVQNREPDGIIPSNQFEETRTRLKLELERDRSVPPLRLFTPQEMYTEVRGIAPDLMLYTDDLKYRVAGTIGHKQLSIPTNDTGPDHINHDFEGIFIHSGPGIAGKLIQNISIYDIFPMICNLFRII